MRVGIIGASGFTGAELMRLLVTHDQFELVLATGDSQAGNPIAGLYPSLAAAYGDRIYDPYEPSDVSGLDLVFCALPHGASEAVVAEIRGDVDHIVDLGSDFRLHDPSLYPQWYESTHKHPELLDEFAYGLPELFRDDLVGAELIAATGCNVAASVFALAPLVAAHLVEPTALVANVIAGVSGAGRPPKEHTTFCAVDGDVTAYGILTHRHTPEIEQALSEYANETCTVTFTPHLAPLSRGILATCTGRATDGATTETVMAALHDAYADEPFIVVSDNSPSTKATLGANTVHVTARVDERTGTVLAIAALDNLVKGASGMAIQCANLACGLPEGTGLPIVGLYP
jgi:N-acetyl-gamma-glutamyl-phosphate reductase